MNFDIWWLYVWKIFGKYFLYFSMYIYYLLSVVMWYYNKYDFLFNKTS